MTKQFQEIDYSGDVGIEAWGSTPAEMLENAARGLFGLMASAGVTGAASREVRVTSISPETLMADWLSEIITIAATHGELYCDVAVEHCTATEARGTVSGEQVDARRHTLRFDVKAATYHDLLLENEDGVWHGRVILDL